ncbi:MAG: hypothetical protein AAF437_04060 [Pseudomonadota bacterium]
MAGRKIQAGDTYSFGNDVDGYGRLIICLSNISLFIVVFEELQRERSSELAGRTPLLCGWTQDALIYHSRWLLEEESHPLPDFAYPKFKVPIEGEIWVTDVTGAPQKRASKQETALLLVCSLKSGPLFELVPASDMELNYGQETEA